MVQEVIWSDEALLALGDALQYLEENFSKIETKKFTDRIKRKVILLKSNPRLGRKVSKKPNTYKTVINKRIVLYYLYKPIKKEIHLLAVLEYFAKSKKIKRINYEVSSYADSRLVN